ncbi:hypothetical protein BJX70DRAFT_379863 [Aspergillus crustosus]
MSGPFNQNSIDSPLSPQPHENTPVSFRTNVNRAKTKRWVEAKKYSYDGDDWGEDEYGEYEYDDDPPESQNQRPGANQSTPDISSTLPKGKSHPPLPSMDRLHSIERAQTLPTEGPAAPGNPPASIVRPADIYKRMREEHKVHQQGSADTSTTEHIVGTSTPISSVLAENVAAEQPHQMATGSFDHSVPPATHTNEPAALSLPDVKRLSAFSPHFFTESTPLPQNVQEPASQPSHELQHNPSLGFRSAVNQAFDVPETPSTITDSVARSNSASTTGISPIIPRRDTTDDKTPTILEDPNENADTPTEKDPVFKPGHRRDLSLPSPGNSPSRRPIITEPEAIVSSELGQLSAGTPADSQQQQHSSNPELVQPREEDTGRDLPAPLSVQTNVAPGPLAAANDSVPVIIPSMSTENSPEDTENDRLRKEIIRSLSRENTPSDQQDQTPPQTSGQDTLVPRDSESYWAEQQIISPSGPQPSTSALISAPTASEIPPIEPPASTSLEGPRPKLKKRFSWEESSDDDESTPVVTQAQPSRPPPMPGQYPFSQDSIHPESVLAPPTSQPSDIVEDVGLREEPTSEPTVQPAPEKPKLTVVTPSTVGTPTITQSIQPEPAGPEYIQPVQSQTTETLTRDDEGQSFSPGQSFSEAHTYIPSTSIESGLLGFKEILGMQSADERVQAFDHTRDQFAAIDTGLSHWVQVTVQAHPEHSDVVDRNTKPLSEDFRNNVPRAKFPKLTSLGNLASSLQDGSHSTSGHTRRPSAHLGTVKQSQVGKDFLHTAGVLGGQAGKAAKGLFSKGRSKLKGSGGSEKGFQSMRGYHRPIRLSDLQLDLETPQDLHDPHLSRQSTATRIADATTRSGEEEFFVQPPAPTAGRQFDEQSSGQQQCPAGSSIPCAIGRQGEPHQDHSSRLPHRKKDAGCHDVGGSAQNDEAGEENKHENKHATLHDIPARGGALHQLPSVSSLGVQEIDLGPPAAVTTAKLDNGSRSSQVSLPSDLGDAQPRHLGDRIPSLANRTTRGSNLLQLNTDAIQNSPAEHSGRPFLLPTPRLLSPLSPQHDWSRRPEQISSSRDPAFHRNSSTSMEKLKSVGRFRRISKEPNQSEFKPGQPPKRSFDKLTGLFSRTQHKKAGAFEHVASSSENSARHYLAPTSSRPDSRIAGSSISSVDYSERPVSLRNGRNASQAQPAPPEGYFAHESPESFSVVQPHQQLHEITSSDRMRLSDPTPMDTRRLSPHSTQYHSSPATPQRQPHVTSPRHSSPVPSPALRTSPRRGRSEDRSYAEELQLRSRSPKAFAPRPEERNLPKHDPTDPAYRLGAFRSSNPRTSRVGDQELPWKITIPGDADETMASTSASWRREIEGVLNGTKLPTYHEDVEEHSTLQRTPKEKRAIPFSIPPVDPVPLQTTPASPEHPHRNGARAINTIETPIELPVRTDDNSSEEIMMSSTAYPGQEWRPLGFSEWDHQ